MSSFEWALMVYCALPLLSLAMLLVPIPYLKYLGPGELVTLLRVGILFFCSSIVFQSAVAPTIGGTLVAGYPMRFELALSKENLLFLLMLDLAFLVVYSWIDGGRIGRLRLALYFLVQLFSSPFLLSENLLVTAGLQLGLGALFFQLLKAHRGEPGASGAIEWAANQIYNFSVLMAVIVVIWGLKEHGGSLKLGLAAAGQWGSVFWVVLILASILPHLLGWFSRASLDFPRYLFVVTSCYLATVLYKYIGWQSLFGANGPIWLSSVVAGFGFLCSAAFLWRILFVGERGAIISYYVSFLFSLVLVVAGSFSFTRSTPALYLLLALPLLTALLMGAKDLSRSSRRALLASAALFLILLGVPGSPLFLTFSGLGARALQIGAAAVLVFVLLWLLHLWAVFHWIMREVFRERQKSDLSISSTSGDESFLMMALVMVLVLVTQIAGRWV